MIEKGRISALQMAIMMYITIVATSILFIPSITAKYAERDLWISPIWASFSGFFIVYITWQLHKLYPKDSLIEYSEHILGRIIGKVIGFIYLFFILHDTGIAIREYGEFVVSSFLQRTPTFVVMGSITLVCAFAVKGGIEVIGRCAQIIIPVVIFMWLLLFLLLVSELEPKNVFPIMEYGLKPSIMGSIVPSAWLSQYSLISFLFPLLTDQEKEMKWGMISVVVVMFTMVITNIGSLFLFGQNIINFNFLIYEAARYISIGGFFENLEAMVIVIWVAGGFVQISLFYYMLVLGTAQWLKLSNYRPVVFPIGFLAVLFSFWSLPNFIELVHFIETIAPFYFLVVQLVIPILLFTIAFAQKKIMKLNMFSSK
ncbi:endospore germination permease [Bacillus sp. V3B]|uniref:GerAB/ArcD/ProY family transporter n=1 Tax=Bacillus sp. V3B TaxID=2804915 RepID=UPI00210E03A3|nr:endospore germination permease [Bacillus sp. V3B]MCQ6277370.1 endospore germination permease [Bacillus sp. V3B]